jgi:hypothetical protein
MYYVNMEGRKWLNYLAKEIKKLIRKMRKEKLREIKN